MAIAALPIIRSKGMLDFSGTPVPLQERTAELCRRLLAVNSLSISVASAKDVQELCGHLARYLEEWFPEESVNFCIREGEAYRRVHVSGPTMFDSEATYSLGHGLMGAVLRSGTPVFIEDSYSSMRTVQFVDRGAIVAPRSIMILPLVSNHRVTGALEVVSCQAHKFDEGDYQLGEILSEHISCSLENILTRQELASTRALLKDHDAMVKLLSQQLREQAHTDEGTGLFNRRRLLEQLDAEIARARRYGEIFSCLMIDIDHFKRINDSYGHPAGDEVLRQFASVLKNSLRITDLVARYGGEEFTVLLPRADGPAARHVAELLQRRIKSHTFVLPATGTSIHISVSIGVVTCTGFDRLDKQQVIVRADKLLYSAKNAGRDQICFSEDAEAEATEVKILAGP